MKKNDKYVLFDHFGTKIVKNNEKYDRLSLPEPPRHVKYDKLSLPGSPRLVEYDKLSLPQTRSSKHSSLPAPERPSLELRMPNCQRMNIQDGSAAVAAALQ